ncbi:hypothetical protein GC173_18695 [bacterium]|nr:hypothetical protein [bacterium]
MRSASSKKFASLALLASLMAGSAFAAPKISDWSVQTSGNEETLSLQWNEEGAVEVSSFSESRQFIAVISGATLSEAAQKRTLSPGASKMFSRVRVNPVTLSSGEKAVQLTADLTEWTEVRTESTGDSLKVILSVPASIQAETEQATAAEPGLELTDELVAEMLARGAGSAQAPAAGAGQAPANDALSNYYVPPSAAGAPPSATDLGQIQIDNKLSEMVARVDFQGTELENVLRLIAERAELNILIKPEDVKTKKVTLRLRNVTLRQMLDAILKMNDLGYTIEPGAIVNVVPRRLVKTSDREMATETIILNWVDVTEVRTALRPFIDSSADSSNSGGSDTGRMEAATSSNMLIIRDVPENVRMIRELVSRLDRPEKQVLIELRLVNLSESASRSIGTRTSFQDQAYNPRTTVDPDTGGIGTSTISGSNSASGSTSDSASSSLSGVTRSSSASSSSSSTSSGSTSIAQDLVPNSSGALGLLAPGASAASLRTVGTIGVLGADFDVNFQVNAEEQRGEAVTLANPTVLSLNNVEASVEITRKIPYQTGINTDQGSVATVSFEEVGTKVNLLPRITDNGYVQMTVEPEQTIDTGARPGGVPQTDVRKVSASVIVKDEQTIAFGGLRQFDSSASENGVPYLLRVPVLSWLFKNQSNSQNKTELYLFVTPHIVKDPTPTTYQQALYEKIDYNYDLPDYYFDEVAARKGPGELAPKDKKK